jgi:hypothetical protein
MNHTKATIAIKPDANRHALFLTTTGTLLLLFVILLSQFYWDQVRLLLVFGTLVSLVITFIGINKLLEPRVSFYLTPQFLRYQHRYGHWQICWDDIQIIAQIKQSIDIDTDDLPYLGISLRSLASITDNISPRLANRLMHEQRPLLVYCVLHQLMSYEQASINFEPYRLTNGTEVKGPLAGFMHQCSALKIALGYHLFIPATAIDRDTSSFATLLRQCKNASLSYQ